ncbi:MAG: chemotaxis protein CheW [Tissierellia bacterium]|nr:chemotaxis protein CheW [Tissierellia bacterium]
MSDSIDNKYVVFKLNEEYYGLPIGKVKAIERMSQTTRIPNTYHYIKGVMNLRGEVVTVLDLRTKLNLPEKEIDNNSRTIVVMEGETTVGLIVDSSSEVLTISADSIDSTNTATTIDSNMIDSITGIGKTEDGRLVIILELAKILEN